MSYRLSDMTFADVAAFLNNPANHPTRRERENARRESDRSAKRAEERAAEIGVTVESYVSGDHLFAEFEEPGS